MRILIVEDEVRLADALVQIMLEQKYTADAVYNGEDGLAYALSGQYDVVVLDVMLPKRNGFEVVRAMRREKNATPVLLLTAKEEISDKVQGLGLRRGRLHDQTLFPRRAACAYPRLIAPAGGCGDGGNGL